MVIVPLLAPHAASVGVTATALGPFVLAMLEVVENVHPFASFTLIECDPARSEECSVGKEYPLPSNEYVYGDVPPVTVPMVIVPLLAPQATLVGVTATADGPFVLAMLAVIKNVHPFASLTLIECDPALRLL